MLLAGLLGMGLGCEGGEPVTVDPLGPAPGFRLPLISGGELDLESLRGRLVVLDFWATWCAPCEVQMPILDALWREAGDEGVMVVGISVDTDPPAEVAAWVAERGFDYPIALGDQALAMRYGVLGFPSLVLVDREGRIQARHTGVWRRDEIDAHLEAIRRGEAPAP
ncbi:MAG: TlpA disulfide reductase family protein [Myxococcota bacterium]